MPIVIYQTWAFVAPGLYKKEKRFAIPLVVSSILLFYAGLAFAYAVVFPLMFAFFNAVAPEGVTVMTDINNYLDFVLVIFFAFGIAFEVPIATVMLVWSGLTTPKQLGACRAYVFLGAFVAGMLLTPPDVISQTLLAVPIYLLYEVGIIMSRFMMPENKDKDQDDADAA
jgi:sec-independent protein translocase protein TatC